MVQQLIDVNRSIESVQSDVIGWRRYLHMHPEISFQEEKTAQFVYETLQSFGNLEISRPTKTSVVARLIGGQPGKVLGLRGDMDALAIHEENDFEFASKVPGVMHACGHDAHTAMLLGTAKILTSMKESIKGEVRFVFQHAEEIHPGGAQEMVKAGVLDGVDCMIGVHLISTIPVGKIVLNYGPVTANSDRFDITIKGKGGHASQPENAIDPLVIGAQVVTNLQQIVARNANPQDKLVLSVTNFQAGLGAYNVIPDSVKLSGSVRSFGEDVRELTVRSMERIVKGITEAHGATYELDYRYGYGSVINEENITKLVEEAILEQWDENPLLEMPALMGGEDFSAFSNEVPSCFVLIGAGNEEKGITYPHHHPRFTVDEDSFKDGVKLFVHTVQKILG
ncbi:amidohydrolase [Lysinibacillus composti]|uniref:Amidohydrolase n=1 Tax=Lysinibacillus composti TaxID=720633 RepID=A0A3N9UDS9_9BACI|nr:amidohydrolase [Lysinibacillus composti]MBM7608915.1 amidohydrolase [Lysinibacillus composti]RQW74493.1 amidohydrolase [Lysinibacillus composti]